MSMTVGVREFRADLADYINREEQVTVTRHGQPVGLFIPVKRNREAALEAYAAANRRAQEWLTEIGMTEDEFVEEAAKVRKAMRAEARK